jgi:hypothetical protein
LPSDPFISEMDPALKIWLYQQWIGDHRDDGEIAKNHAYLLGSFSNPEAVQKAMNDNVHESSDEDFEESLKMVTSTDIRIPDIGSAPKRRRHKSKLIS